MKATIRLQNVQLSGCRQNVKIALEMIEGVRSVHVKHEEQVAEVLFDPPATPLQMREQLLMAGYLAEHPHRDGSREE